jgi:DNA adenine methylase
MPLVKEREIQLKVFYDTKIENNFLLRKNIFLKSLQSPSGKQKYKRYTDGTPLRYAGGKTLAVGYIVEHLPNDLKRIVSPFFGGGSFEIACAKELGIEVIGFDIFEILVNYWQQQFANPDGLYEYLKTYKPTREVFNEIKEKLKKHWKGEKIIKDKLELAALYFFNHNTSYGPGFLSWPSNVYMDEKKYSAMIEKVKNLKLSNISIQCDSFENVIPKYKNEFLYCDPPYYLGGDSKMFRGIYPQRNFPIHHNNFNHEKLRDLLYQHKGGFILSYNDCSTIREWYKDFEIVEVAWQYTMGQGETRIGFNRMKENRTHVKQSHEILIIKR